MKIIFGGILGIGFIIALIFFLNSEEETQIDKPLILANYTSKLPDLSNKSQEEINEIIEKRYLEIEKNSNEYEPLPRIWQSSGPFKIDREKYLLGEKVFLIVEGLSTQEKGVIALVRHMNSTHDFLYTTFPFDGSEKQAFNIYFEPSINKLKNICSKDFLIGDWSLIFTGTDYNELKFKIIDAIIPGSEQYFQDVC